MMKYPPVARMSAADRVRAERHGLSFGAAYLHVGRKPSEGQ